LEISSVAEIVMLRLVAASVVAGVAASWVGGLPAVRPHVEFGQHRLARYLDLAALALEGSSESRRSQLATIERVAEFPEGTPVRALARAVGMLRITITDAAGTSINYQCTATVIAPGLLITNDHCLETKAVSDTIRLELWVDHVGSTAESYIVEPTPLERDAQLDYALLRITAAPGRSLPAPLPRVIFRVASPGERLLILHHSRSQPLQVTRTRCRVGTAAPATERELRHTCATLAGSSGALVLAEHDHAVVGLHRARRIRDDRDPGVATSIQALLAKSAILRNLASAGSIGAISR
jgi:hypothetical protein